MVAKNESSRSGKQLGGFVMRGLDLRSIEFWVVNGVGTVIGEDYWQGMWVGTDIYASKDWILI